MKKIQMMIFVCVLLFCGNVLALNISDIETLNPIIMAGDPDKDPTDSPEQRIDLNTTTSLWAGIGSVKVSVSGGITYLGSGTPISSRHVLTAGHMVDLDHNGVIDSNLSVYFNLNYGSNLSHTISASGLALHPDFAGFFQAVNDDLAILTLESDLPAGVPIYDLYSDPLQLGNPLTMIGYGRSGDGISGTQQAHHSRSNGKATMKLTYF